MCDRVDARAPCGPWRRRRRAAVARSVSTCHVSWGRAGRREACRGRWSGGGSRRRAAAKIQKKTVLTFSRKHEHCPVLCSVPAFIFFLFPFYRTRWTLIVCCSLVFCCIADGRCQTQREQVGFYLETRGRRGGRARGAAWECAPTETRERTRNYVPGG